MRTGRPPKDLFQRFAEKLQLNWETDCWEWIGGKSPAGYGIFTTKSEYSQHAHCISYDWFVGPVPKGFDVHHKCKNRACENPNHLEALSRKKHGLAHAGTKTHCNAGHPMTAGNLTCYTTPSGKKRTRCKTCSSIQQKARLAEYRKVVPPKPHASSAKTHCKRGHEFTSENTRITVAGSRQCRICFTMLVGRWKAKQAPTAPRGTPKENCKHGHEMTPENTYAYRGRRSCRICILDRIHKSRSKLRTLLDMPEPEGSKTEPNQAQAVNQDSK